MERPALALLSLLVILPLQFPTVGLAAPPRLAVMDLRAGGGITAAEARSLTGMLRTALHETGTFGLINREDMEEIAENHKVELLLCDDDACLFKIGSLLGAEKLVAGDVGIVVDEFVVNARLVDVAGDALFNERVATRRSGRSARELQQAMGALAADLAGRAASPAGDLPRLRTAGERGGRISDVDEGRVVLDVGRWDGAKKGALFEVLSTVPFDREDSLRARDGRLRPRPVGKIEVVEVFDAQSAAVCRGGLRPQEFRRGDAVRSFRFPRWLSIEPFYEYSSALAKGAQDFWETWDHTGETPPHVEYIHRERTVQLGGNGVGLSLTFFPHGRVQPSLSIVGAEAYEFSGTYSWYMYPESGLPASQEGIPEPQSDKRGFHLFGPSLRIRLVSTLHVDAFVEPLLLFVEWPGDETRSEENEGGMNSPWGMAGVRLGIRLLAPTHRLGLLLAPGLWRTAGGDWTAASWSLRIGPSYVF